MRVSRKEMWTIVVVCTLAGILCTGFIFGAITGSPVPVQAETVIEYVPQIEYVEVEKEVLVQTAVDVIPQGEFEVTYYTAGYESTGKRPGDKGYGVTRSGAIVDANVTVAVDPKVIPLGTYLYIEGIGLRVAQDTGSAIKGNKIDIYTPKLEDARKGGRHKAKVYILRVKDNE